MPALFADQAPFATPRPERLLERVLQIATNAGDVVLDCFGGSGTTAAVALKMRRRWVTVEKEPSTVDTFNPASAGEGPAGRGCRRDQRSCRLEKVGGFRQLEVGPSMYDGQDGRALLGGG